MPNQIRLEGMRILMAIWVNAMVMMRERNVFLRVHQDGDVLSIPYFQMILVFQISRWWWSYIGPDVIKDLEENSESHSSFISLHAWISFGDDFFTLSRTMLRALKSSVKGRLHAFYKFSVFFTNINLEIYLVNQLVTIQRRYPGRLMDMERVKGWLG